MTTKFVMALIGVLVLSVPPLASAKGFQRVVLVASDGRSVDVQARESVIDRLLSRRGASERIRGGYLRLFFVGLGGFPANPARWYPGQGCVALDWPAVERTCRHVAATATRLLVPGHELSRFRVPPTVLARITYSRPVAGPPKSVTALRSPVELALDRAGRTAREPSGCFPLSGRWQGPAASRRPHRFLLCAQGVYANHRLYPLRRGVWEWFRLNVG